MKSSVFTVVILGSIVALVAAGPPCRNPPNMLRPDQCCEFPKSDNEEKVVEDCLAKHGAQMARLMADKSDGPARGSCVAECILKGLGKGDLGAMDEHLKGVDSEWMEIFKGIDGACRPEGEKRKAEFEAGFKLAPLDPADEVCHPKYGFAMMCGVKHMINNCPAKFFKDTPECRQLQDFSKSCEL